MNCAKCGLDLPPGIKTCPKCGLTNEFAPAQQPEKKQPSPILYVAATLLAVALLALVVAVIAGRGNKNVTSAPSGLPAPPGNVTSAPSGQPSGGGLVSAPSGKPVGGDTAPSNVPKPKPPKEVVDYLNYVKTVEAHRQKLLDDTTSALTLAASGGGTQGLLDMIDMAMDPDGAEARDPLAETKKELARQYVNWVNTLKYFDQKPAPAQCREFSGAYRDVLYKETKTIHDLTINFNKVNIMDPKDMGKLLDALQKMKRDESIQGSIDQAADNADEKLDVLVSYYDMEKPFNVPREKATHGSIMGF